MEHIWIAIWERNRQNYVDFMKDLSPEQLNTIPNGSKNNIIWHVGHILVTQQALLYSLSNLEMGVSKEQVFVFKTGSIPQTIVTPEQIRDVEDLLTSQVHQLKKDVVENKFTTYQPYTTVTGFTLTSFDAAGQFNNYHEGLHFGIIMQLRKSILR
ncbi:MAG: DinB family protein [Cytophagaceae bacterium]|jgi:hypothetical protein|nr:DinB family protein [Cytophagaceae bacterium]